MLRYCGVVKESGKQIKGEGHYGGGGVGTIVSRVSGMYSGREALSIGISDSDRKRNGEGQVVQYNGW